MCRVLILCNNSNDYQDKVTLMQEEDMMLVGVQIVEQQEDPGSRVKQEPKSQETALKVFASIFTERIRIADDRKVAATLIWLAPAGLIEEIVSTKESPALGLIVIT